MYFNSIDLLVKFEGLKNKVYLDGAAKKTIGIGHLLTAEELLTSKIQIDGKYYDYSLGLDDHLCKKLCLQDLERFIEAVDSIVYVDLNQNQFDALVIFCYNVGIRVFKESTLVKMLNEGNYKAVPLQLRRWNKIGTAVSQGLVNRRNAEIKLWLTPE